MIGVIVVLLLSWAYLASCTKQQKEEQQSNVKITVLDQKSSSGGWISYRCIGSCYESQGLCWLNDLNPPVVYCDCESAMCALEIVIDGYTKEQWETATTDIAQFMTDFKKFANEEHGNGVRYFHVLEQGLFKGYEVFQAVYSVDSPEGDKYSVLLMTTFDENNHKAAPQRILFNCVGTCDDDTEQCNEQLDTTTGDVYCGCESDNCKMVIEVMD